MPPASRLAFRAARHRSLAAARGRDPLCCPSCPGLVWVGEGAEAGEELFPVGGERAVAVLAALLVEPGAEGGVERGAEVAVLVLVHGGLGVAGVPGGVAGVPGEPEAVQECDLGGGELVFSLALGG